MQTINIDQIKPASDAERSAYEAWHEAGQHEARLRLEKHPVEGSIAQAITAKGQARERWEKALIALAVTTHEVIARAE